MPITAPVSVHDMKLKWHLLLFRWHGGSSSPAQCYHYVETLLLPPKAVMLWYPFNLLDVATPVNVCNVCSSLHARPIELVMIRPWHKNRNSFEYKVKDHSAIEAHIHPLTSPLSFSFDQGVPWALELLMAFLQPGGLNTFLHQQRITVSFRGTCAWSLSRLK